MAPLKVVFPLPAEMVSERGVKAASLLMVLLNKIALLVAVSTLSPPEIVTAPV